MNKFKFLKVWAIIFAFVVSCGALTSCSDDDDAPVVSTEWIEGDWNAEGTIYYSTDGGKESSYTERLNITINADGTCIERRNDYYNRWWLRGSTFGVGYYEDDRMWDVMEGQFEKIDDDKFVVHYDYIETDMDEDHYGDNELHKIHYVGDVIYTRQ